MKGYLSGLFTTLGRWLAMVSDPAAEAARVRNEDYAARFLAGKMPPVSLPTDAELRSDLKSYRTGDPMRLVPRFPMPSQAMTSAIPIDAGRPCGAWLSVNRDVCVATEHGRMFVLRPGAPAFEEEIG